MLQNTYHNPLLPGFYPDPSICRVGDDYYMVTSSFVYYPGLPIFHSKDLVHWEQVGHGIHRPEQLDYKNCETSEGLWAPSIRYHNGTYYIINTFVSAGREADRDNYIITAKNPAGPWSNPIVVKGADGIDSSLFFDDDGSLWYVGNYISPDCLYEGHHGIYLNELDPETFQFKGPRYIIWDGVKTRSKWIEAPHIYKKDGWYYLLVAEGGTFVNHSVQMARCRTIQGDYEICPRNPIVSHRHMPLLNPISVTGHADIVETQNGEWWMVLLAVRPYEGGHYNLGRETFMVPIIWAEDGWPMERKKITLPLTRELARTLHAGDQVLLTGTIYTSRDAGHKRMCEALAKGEKIPFDPTDATIYYVGPTPAKPGAVIGSAGPTTSGRMDAYAPTMMSVGARGMIGKGARLPEVVDAMKKYDGVYFGAIGGAGALLAKCIKKAELIAYEDLGAEALRKLYVEDMPLVVIIDSEGNNLYEMGKAEYLKEHGDK